MLTVAGLLIRWANKKLLDPRAADIGIIKETLKVLEIVLVGSQHRIEKRNL